MARTFRTACALALAVLVALAGVVVTATAAGATAGAARGTATPTVGSLTATAALLSNPLLTVPVNAGLALGAPADAASAAGAGAVSDSRTVFANAGVSVLGVNLGLLSADTVTRQATANATAGSASAQQRLAGLALLGGLVRVGALESSCSIDPSASTSQATFTGVTVGGTGVALVRGGPTTSITVGGTVVGLRLAAGGETTDGAGRQTVTSDTLVVGVTGGLDLGLVRLSDLGVTLTLGASTCTAPTPASAVTSLTPASGPDGGGTSVVIAGSGFSGATGVTFGGVPATSWTITSDSSIAAVAPAHAPGPVPVVVSDPEGDGQGTYTHLAVAPTVTGTAPAAGPDGGGTTVTLTGSGFRGVTGVRFGGTPATSVTVTSDSSMTAVAPAGSAGSVVDLVLTEAGFGDTVLSSAFSYLATAPDLTAVSPGNGPDGGGGAVRLTGTGLLGVAAVAFGGTPATSVTVVSDTRIDAVAPAGATGTTVGVTLTEGAASDMLPGAYRYDAVASAPATAAPSTGPDTGGTPVVITGSGFTGATAVTFGGVPGTDVLVVSDTEVRATSPAGAVGTVSLAVVEGGSSALVPGGFTHTGLPSALAGLSPDRGPDSGGTVVTLTGTGFTGATGVVFGATAGTGFSVLGDTSIRVTAPAGAVGGAPVTVLDAAGSGTSGNFTYGASPATVAGLSPVEGPDSGGTVVTVNGTGFTGTTAVTFDGVPGTALTLLGDGQLRVTTPPGVAGPADVVVVDGGGPATRTAAFSYVTTPAVVTGLSPAAGSEAGGTLVTVTGSGLSGATGVSFDGVPGTGFSVVSDSTATVTTPAGTAGAADVLVGDRGGDGFVPDAFTYTGAPAAPRDVVPATGQDAGGDVVTVLGSGFTGSTAVTFGGVPGTSFVAVSDIELRVTTPPGPVGAVDVVVVDSAGDGTLAGAFAYTGTAPTVTSAVPAVGPVSGGTRVTITGSGLMGVTAVTFDGVAGTTLTVPEDGHLTVLTPAHTAGPVDVVLTDPAGTVTLTGAFTFQGTAATVTGVSPAGGPETGGTLVTLTGTGFDGSTAVVFGGVPGTDLTGSGSTSLTVRAPAGVPGPAVDVVLVDDGGAVTTAGAWTWTGEAAAVTALDPASGPDSGGRQVRVTGAGFTSATGVLFDGVPGVGATVQADGSILVTTPPATAGDVVDVTVTDPSGDSTLPDAYRYTGSLPVIDAVDPAQGPDAGGSTVTLTGSGFTGVTAVTVGGRPVAVSGTDTELVLTTPAGTAGTTTIVVTDDAGTATADFGYTGAAARLTGISPVSGPDTGGTPVTLTGTGLQGVTGVDFGGVAGVVVGGTDRELVVTAPAAAAGATVDVTVHDRSGDGSLPGSFSYVGSPAVVTAVDPTTGPDGGGSTVTITGSGFTGADRVVFGGAPATVVSARDDQLVVTSPSGVAGVRVDLVVVDPAGDSAPTGYTYTGSPVAVTAVDPAAGPDSGGTAVTLTGSGFTGVTGVTVDGVAAAVTRVTDTSLTLRTPPGTAGAVEVRVADPAGAATAGFGYTDSPAVIDTVGPDSGPDAGGTPVTLTGSGLTGATAVLVGGTPAVFDVVDDRRLTLVTPPGTAGGTTVTVVDAGGDATAAFTWTAAAPAVTTLDPAAGPDAGGTPVTVTGSGLTGVTAVSVGGTTVPATVLDDARLQFSTPRGTAGPVEVVLGDPAGTAAAGYVYTATPAVVDEVAPAGGPDAGGTLVVLTGSGFTGATGVTVGGEPAVGVTVNSDTRITLTTPPGALGTADLVVADPGGYATAGFRYRGTAAALTDLRPATGSEAGGTTVTLTGTGFTNATGVTFDGVAGTGLERVGDTGLRVVTPAGVAGSTAAVVVTDDAGDSTEPVGYGWVAEPATVSAVTPPTGDDAGGTTVVLTGSGLTGATGVRFGDVAGTDVRVESDTLLTVTAPAGTGTVDLVVTDPAGDGTATGAFTFSGTAAAPASLTPERGPDVGGTAVVLTGSGFTGATGVLFGGVPGTDVRVVSDSRVTVTSPASAAGTVDVVVTDPAGDGTLPAAFTVEGRPATALAVEPGSGPATGGTAVTLTGSGLTGATGLTVGGSPATSFVVVSDTEVTAVTPAGAEGPADVTVLDPDGDATVAGGFAYQPVAPTVTGLLPALGPDGGGTAVTLTGSGLTGVTGVLVAGRPARDVVVVDDTRVTAVTPAGTAGPATVAVLDPAGSATGLFDYVPTTAVLAAMSPNNGPDSGGTPVTFTGSGFTGATGVTFDGVLGASFSVDSDSRITVTSPPGPMGWRRVQVVDDGGSTTRGFRYTMSASQVERITPGWGSTAGGTVETITGTGFTGTTEVRVAGALAELRSLTDTEIVIVVPPGVEGPADVSILDSGEVRLLAAAHEYDAAPAVTGVSPASGPDAGGTTVTLTGTGLWGVTGVTVGGTAATVLSATEDTLRLETPAGVAGPTTIELTDPLGEATAAFAYLATPAVTTSVTPDHGPETGGTTVVVTGTGLTGVGTVLFGRTPGTDLRVGSDTELTVVSPAGPAGSWDLTLLDTAGAVHLTSVFTFDPAPAGTDPADPTDPTGTAGPTGSTGPAAPAGPTDPGTSLTTGTVRQVVASAAAPATRPAAVPAALAWTGAPVTALLGLATLTLLGGVALTAAGRRRRDEEVPAP